MKPDLIVLDIGLPKLNGIEAARQIRQLSPSSKIVFLSQNHDLDVVRAAWGTGALGYVYKTDFGRDFLPAIQAVLRGQPFVSSTLKGREFTDTAGEKAPHRHEVQFYSDDAVFLDSFTRFISAALKASGVAIVVATESHRDSLVERLRGQGLDIDEAIRQGTYISLDVAKTLSTFIVNDMPDANLFLEVMGGFIRSAAKAGKGTHPRVAACGECAPLLRARGKEEAAIRLEQLWNGVGKAVELDILCGYDLSNFHGDEDEHVFHSICAEHSAVYSQ